MKIRGKFISQYHPFLYTLSVWEKRLRRRFSYCIDGKTYTSTFQSEKLPARVKKHQSKLMKKLGDTDMQLQRNKVENLKIVVKEINGVLIKPGETFSFCKTVGRPTKKRGFLPGMELSFGKAQQGVGGGICQASNLLHWLALHSPLTITERHHHSFDPFPDQGRVLPFASGATIFYNYIDFQITNNTEHTFQINLWLTDKLLEGEIRVDEVLPYVYHVFEKNHKFIKRGEHFFRTNEIWRKKTAKIGNGTVLDTEMMFRNFGRVVYTPEQYEVEEI